MSGTRRATVLLGCLVLLAAQARIRLDPEDLRATLLFVAAASFLGWILAPRTEEIPPEPAPLRWGRGSVALLVLALGTLCLGTFLLSRDWNRWCFTGWGLFLASCTLASAGLRAAEPTAPAPKLSRAEGFALLAIFLLGLFLRFHRYAEFPDPWTTHAIEEQQTGYGGYRMLFHGARPWEFFLDQGLAALGLWVTGERNFLAIRIPFTIASALTVVPVFFLLRSLFRPGLALAGAFLYAVSSWNLLYARCAHNIFFPNLLVVGALALLVHFGRTRRLAGLPWAGLFSGYTLYGYAGYRGTSLFVLLFLSGVLLADLRRWRRTSFLPLRGARSRARLGRSFLGLLLVLLPLAASAVPLSFRLGGSYGYYFEAARRSLANRSYYTSDPAEFLRQRAERIRQVARIFSHHGDESLTFNAPGEPMLDPLLACLFTAGFFLAVFSPRVRYHAFFVFVFLVLLAGGTVFVQNLDVRRLQGVTVFVVFFAVTFLAELGRVVGGLGPRVRRAILAALGFLAAAFALGWNFDVYFRKFAQDPRVREAFKNQYTTLIRWGRSHGAGREVFLLSLVDRFFDPTYYYRSHYSWLVDDVLRGHDARDVHDLFRPRVSDPGARPTVIVQRPYEEEAVAELLRALYPGTRCEPVLEPDNPYVAFTVCELATTTPSGALVSTLRGRYWTGTYPAGEPFLERTEPFLGYAVVPHRCGEATCFAAWEGEFEVAEREVVGLRLETRNVLRLEATLDGTPLGHEDRRVLDPGRHVVTVRALLRAERGSGVRLLRTAGGESRVLPFYRILPPAGETGEENS
ncbi:MAG: hypothetical protein KatS3mg076_1561 [Candidatus Binatia bacterium]|nr:MAG: hypothetical protein KatS3mg076_1561 [Candidatus Binatia bacterium]